MRISQQKSKAIVSFETRALRMYTINGYVVKVGRKLYADINMPFITFQHNDLKNATEVFDGLRAMVNWASKAAERGKPSGFTNTPAGIKVRTIDRVAAQVFKNTNTPLVEAYVDEDQFIRWNFFGHAFNDDLPGVVAYCRAINYVITVAKNWK